MAIVYNMNKVYIFFRFSTEQHVRFERLEEKNPIFALEKYKLYLS